MKYAKKNHFNMWPLIEGRAPFCHLHLQTPPTPLQRKKKKKKLTQILGLTSDALIRLVDLALYIGCQLQNLRLCYDLKSRGPPAVGQM